MSFRVNKKQCSTCIFGPNSPIDDETLKGLQEIWEKEDRGQQCHHATLLSKDTGCRGHYEAGKAGKIHHPITTIAYELFDHEPKLSLKARYDIFEGMGWVEMEEVEDEGL